MFFFFFNFGIIVNFNTDLYLLYKEKFIEEKQLKRPHKHGRDLDTGSEKASNQTTEVEQDLPKLEKFWTCLASFWKCFIL